MSEQPPRSYTRVAAAIIIAAVFVSAAIFAASARTTTITKTMPETSTSTATPSAGVRLYEVTFRQSGDCTPTAYAAPWSVTLGSWPVAEPSNATLPINTNTGSAGPAYSNSSVLVFSVPNGQYQYHIAVGWDFGNPSGVIDVNGADVTVLLQGPAISCTLQSTSPG